MEDDTESGNSNRSGLARARAALSGMRARRRLKDIPEADGLAGVDLVEIAPPYDVADTTSQLGARVIMDTLASPVEHGHLGNRLTRTEREESERERNRAAGLTE